MSRPAPHTPDDDPAQCFPMLASTSPDPWQQSAEMVAKLLADDIARDWSVSSGLAWLVEIGDFGTAKREISSFEVAGDLSLADADTWRERVQQAQDAADEQLAETWRGLVARCDRAGLDLPPGIARCPAVGGRRADGEQRLAEGRESIASAERNRAHALRQRLDEQQDNLAPEVHKHVESLLLVGELRLAEETLAHPGQPDVPLGVDIAHWPGAWFSTLEQVSHWLSTPDTCPVGIRRYLPGDDDPAGQALVAAVARLVADDPGAVAAYVAAVQVMVADVHGDPVLEEVDGITYTHILLPDGLRLPPLAFTGREPVRFAVGPHVGGARFRLSLELTDAANDHTVIPVEVFLAMLGKDSRNQTRTRDDRLIAMLRSMCVQVGVSAVAADSLLRDGATPRTRARVWWLLHLVGLTATPVQLDSLLEVTGWHTPALLASIGLAADQPALDVDELRRLTDFDGTVVSAVRDDLGDEAFVVLWVFANYETTDEQIVRDYVVDLLDKDKSKVSFDALIDIDKTVQRLLDHGYLMRTAPDELATCGCGVVRMLRRTPDDRIGDSVRSLLTKFQRSRQRIAEEVLHTRLVGEVIHVWAGQEGPQPADDRVNVRANEVARRTFAEWTNPNQSFDLRDECQKVWNRAQSMRSAVDVLFDGTETATCIGAPVAFQLVLENLLLNATRAAAPRTEGDVGCVVVTLTVRADQGIAVIDVEDNGPGLPGHVREAFLNSAVPDSGEHAGKGMGLTSAKYWVEQLFGELELLPVSPVVGGAHFRISLPVAIGA